MRVFPVLTGTAANSLALACCCDPWGAVVCHTEAHISVDECGAPEFFGGGLRLVPIEGDGTQARGRPTGLTEMLDAVAADRTDVHRVPLQAFSMTNLSELGRTYSPAETAALCDAAHAHGLATHLDGARFANAVVGTGATPAELTWRVGRRRDVVRCDQERCARRRGGGLLRRRRWPRPSSGAASAPASCSRRCDSCPSSSWRRSRTTAGWPPPATPTTRPGRLADGLSGAPGVASCGTPDGNELFVLVEAATAEGWKAAGAQFYGAPVGRSGHGPAGHELRNDRRARVNLSGGGSAQPGRGQLLSSPKTADGMSWQFVDSSERSRAWPGSSWPWSPMSSTSQPSHPWRGCWR